MSDALLLLLLELASHLELTSSQATIELREPREKLVALPLGRSELTIHFLASLACLSLCSLSTADLNGQLFTLRHVLECSHLGFPVALPERVASRQRGLRQTRAGRLQQPLLALRLIAHLRPSPKAT